MMGTGCVFSMQGGIRIAALRATDSNRWLKCLDGPGWNWFLPVMDEPARRWVRYGYLWISSW